MTGIRNRLSERPGAGVFSSSEAPRGRPFGGGAGHRNSGIGTSRNYWNCVFFMGNPKISTNCESPGIGGDSACPPEPPLRFAMVLYYLLWNYRSRGMPQRLGQRYYLHVAKKSVEENSVRISKEPFLFFLQSSWKCIAR